jgi:hypothetical protein
MQALLPLEKEWGGTIAERMARDEVLWRTAHGSGAATPATNPA